MQSATSVDDQISLAHHTAPKYGSDLDAALVFSDEGVSGAVANRLGLNRLIRAVETGSSLPVRLPTDTEVRTYVLDLEATLDERPEQARAALSRFFADDSITMVPTDDGGYELRTELLPGAMMLDASTPAGASRRALNKMGCGGTQWTRANASFPWKYVVPAGTRQAIPHPRAQA